MIERVDDMFIISCTKCTYVTMSEKEEDVAYNIKMDGGRIEKNDVGDYKIECPYCACERLNVSRKEQVIECLNCIGLEENLQNDCPNNSCVGITIYQRRVHEYSV